MAAEYEASSDIIPSKTDPRSLPLYNNPIEEIVDKGIHGEVVYHPGPPKIRIDPNTGIESLIRLDDETRGV